MDFRCQGEELRVDTTVVDVGRPNLSISRLMDKGINTFIQAGEQILRRFDGATVDSHVVVVFILHCQAVVPMLLAPVDEEPAEEGGEEKLLIPLGA